LTLHFPRDNGARSLPALPTEVSISMFHSHEVNKEALFANWAYRTIHDAIVPYPPIIAVNSLSWRIQLPDAIKIIFSTAEEGGKIVTEGSATCINYKDFETNKIRRSFSCQFHPELLSYLRGIGKSEAPSYSTLKIDDMVSAYLSNYCM
jgi:hypothetical protein